MRRKARYDDADLADCTAAQIRRLRRQQEWQRAQAWKVTVLLPLCWVTLACVALMVSLQSEPQLSQTQLRVLVIALVVAAPLLAAYLYWVRYVPTVIDRPSPERDLILVASLTSVRRVRWALLCGRLPSDADRATAQALVNVQGRSRRGQVWAAAIGVTVALIGWFVGSRDPFYVVTPAVFLGGSLISWAVNLRIRATAAKAGVTRRRHMAPSAVAKRQEHR